MSDLTNMDVTQHLYDSSEENTNGEQDDILIISTPDGREWVFQSTTFDNERHATVMHVKEHKDDGNEHD